MNDVALNKIQSIQRCVVRAREEFAVEHFDANVSAQDAAVMNVVRACQQAIGLANHVVRARRLGVPATTGESFELLRQQGVIDHALAERLKKMAGFRNIVIHDYQRVEAAVIRAVIETGLDDLILFGDRVRAYLASA